jgi:hypothetical protein
MTAAVAPKTISDYFKNNDYIRHAFKLKYDIIFIAI